MTSISKTKLLNLVKAFDWKAVQQALTSRIELLDYRGKRGENYLHICCGVDIARLQLRALDGTKTADVLIAAGLDVNREAFREGEWKATPLWFAIARGKNLPLANHLLERGASPEYCMWAAAFNDSPEAIRLLIAAGARVDPAGSETPLLFAVRWSRFAAARALLQGGADPNYRDEAGRTALHYMLKKRSDVAHMLMFVEHGARVDLADRSGESVRDVIARSRNLRYRQLVNPAVAQSQARKDESRSTGGRARRIDRA